MEKESKKPTYLKGHILTGSFNPERDGIFAGRTIAVLVITATILVMGTVFAFPAAIAHGTGSTSVSAYGPSHLNGPLK